MSRATIRYRIINRLLIDKGTVSIDEIADVCSEYIGEDISVRTIRDDIKAMREDRMLGWYAPIVAIIFWWPFGFSKAIVADSGAGAGLGT